jgi:DNA-binding response OmpR family regulator
MAKVLLVEDDEILHNMYKKKFEYEGFEVVSAFDGSEGVKKAETEKPDVILMDIIMPKMDGFVAVKKIKKNSAISNVPIVMLTNLGQEEDVNKGRELGADDYFIKANHTPAEIVKKIKDLLALRKK